MNRSSHEKLDRELRDFPVPPPPAGLLKKIQTEIPDSETLAGAPLARTAGSGPSRWPLRIAATLVLGVLGGTVAFQVVKRNQQTEFDRQAAEYDSPNGIDAGGDPFQAVLTPPPPPPAVKALTPKRSDGEAVASPSPESFSAMERQRPSEPVQPAVVPESLQETGAYDTALRVRGKDEAEEVAGVEGGVEGGVAGGVVGGIVGGVPGGIVGGEVTAAAPAPAATAPSTRLSDRKARLGASGSRYPAAYDSVQEAPSGRRKENQDRDLESDREASEDPARQAPPGTMIFRETPANRFEETAEDRRSTFALDVDTGSYTLTRGYLDRGILPPPAAIRVEEFVNAQQYDDPAPRRGDFSLVAEGAPASFYYGERTRLLRFSVKAREVDERDRKPAVLTFVVDVSGSMNQENRLGLVKRALGLLLDELSPDDRVGLVVYGTEGRVLLRHTRDLEEIRRAIAQLQPEGSTNVEEGLRLAYDLADEGWRQGASNRILLCSDGVANVGATGPESILARIGKEAQRGIALTTIGFGMGNYNDALMEQLADQGDGTYHYVDALAEARKVFVENLTGTLETVAKEAKVQVEFDPAAVVRWRLLGYENRDVADRDFRNDRIDAGELGAGHQATALYEVRLRDGVEGSDRIATLRLRWKSVEEKRVIEESRDLRARDLARSWEGASANLRHAALAGAFAEKLKESAAADDFGWRSLRREAAELDRERGRNRSAADLADSIDRAARIAGASEDRENRGDPSRSDRQWREPGRNPRLDED
jgi:Ca-activated chloride channel family protein